MNRISSLRVCAKAFSASLRSVTSMLTPMIRLAFPRSLTTTLSTAAIFLTEPSGRPMRNSAIASPFSNMARRLMASTAGRSSGCTAADHLAYGIGTTGGRP